MRGYVLYVIRYPKSNKYTGISRKLKPSHKYSTKNKPNNEVGSDWRLIRFGAEEPSTLVIPTMTLGPKERGIMIIRLQNPSQSSFSAFSIVIS